MQFMQIIEHFQKKSKLKDFGYIRKFVNHKIQFVSIRRNSHQHSGMSTEEKKNFKIKKYK